MVDYNYTDETKKHIRMVDGDSFTFFPAKKGNRLYDKMAAEGIAPAPYVDPRTPQQIYDETVLVPLDAQVLKDAARMVEDFYDALESQLPQEMKDKHGPLMAERKAKRAARPQ